MLAEARERVNGTRRKHGVGATLLRRSIPMRKVGDWNDQRPATWKPIWSSIVVDPWPGVLFIRWVITDVATGWTECVALAARLPDLKRPVQFEELFEIDLNACI